MSNTTNRPGGRGLHGASLIGGVSLLALSLAVPAAAIEIDEIVVTAQKREQSLQDVPVAVTAVGGDFLEKANIENLEDLQQVAPTVSINSSTGGAESIFTIRGIGTSGQNSGLEQSVGVYIDGVYRGRPGAALGDYVDISQIEVLRGPQNTLFGKNTSAGVISVQTRKPSAESFSDFSVKYDAENDGFVFRGITSGAVDKDENFAMSLAAAFRDTDGFIEDVTARTDVNDRDRYTLRGQLIGNLDDATEIRIIADYTESKDRCCTATAKFYGATGFVIAGGANAFLGATGTTPLNGTLVGTSAGAIAASGFAGVQVNPFSYKTATNADKFFDNFEDQGISAQLTREFNSDTLGPVEATLIGSFRSFDNQGSIDADFTDIDILGNRERDQKIDETSVELRLASTNTEGNFDWIVGAYYFDQDIDLNETLRLGVDARSYANAIIGLRSGFANNITDIENALALPIGTIFPTGNGRDARTDYNAESYAFFASGNWYFEDGWSATAGVRYSSEEKTANITTTAQSVFSQIDLDTTAIVGMTRNQLIDLTEGFQAFANVNPFASKYDDSNVSVAVTVGKEINEDTTAYARYATGYKSGGLNLSAAASGATPGFPGVAAANNLDFDAEEVTAYELGLKRKILDGAGAVNIAVYYQELDDFQSNSFDGLNFTIRNAGKVIGKGAEIDYRIALTEKLFTTGGIVYSDIEFDNFKNGSATQAQITAAAVPGRNPTVVQDLTGRRPVFVSDWNITGSFIYTSDPIKESAWHVEPQVDYQYRTDFHTGQDLDAQTLQDDYFLLNAALTLVNDETGTQWSIWGRNLTDEEVQNISFDTPFQAGSFSSFVRPPRSFGISVRMQFGG